MLGSKLVAMGSKGWSATAGVTACGLAVSFGCGLDSVGSAEPLADVLDGGRNEAAVTDRDARSSDDASLDAANLDAPIEAPSCGDVQSAPLNCGRCGHSCLGGACVAGKCQPVTLVTGEPGLGAVAVDATATTAYYAAENSGVIRKVSTVKPDSVRRVAKSRP